MSGLVPAERIERVILLIRGQKVILDTHLEALRGSNRTAQRAGPTEYRALPGGFHVSTNC